jgi:hypothetical protein
MGVSKRNVVQLLAAFVAIAVQSGCDSGRTGDWPQTAPVSPPAAAGPLGSLARGMGFSPGPAMNIARVDFAYTTTLVCGGFDGTFVLATCESFRNNTFASETPMSAARRNHSMLRLSSGETLVTGGESDSGAILATAEIYNDTKRKWASVANPMKSPRRRHAMVQLGNGLVLISGGEGPLGTIADAELFDPGNGTFGNVNPMGTPRHGHLAVRNLDGTVTVVGGWNGGVPLASTERFVPATGGWTAQAGLLEARGDFAAAELTDGDWLVTGGAGATGDVLASTERFEPLAGVSWPMPPMAFARKGHVAVATHGNRILVASGADSHGSHATAEQFLGFDHKWIPAGSMVTARTGGGALVADYTEGASGVYVFGGMGEQPLRSVERHDGPGKWESKYLGKSSNIRSFSALVRLGDGKVFVTDPPELYDPTENIIRSIPRPSLLSEAPVAALLADGKVLAAGGCGKIEWKSGASTCVNALAAAEVFDPAGERWWATGWMTVPRAFHAIIILSDGRVLAAGGEDNASSETYDPATGTWSRTGDMSTPRSFFTLTGLPDGKVLAAGGTADGITCLDSTELLDASSGEWTPAAPMRYPHCHHSATLLDDGRVLVAGGVEDWAEIYDPASNSWARTGTLSRQHKDHTAALLPGGMVLITPGYGSYLYTGDLYDPVQAVWLETALVSGTQSSGPAVALADGRVLVLTSNHAVLFSETNVPVGQCHIDGDCPKGLVCGAESVCCDRLCNGTCETCTSSGSPGTCVFVPEGSGCYAGDKCVKSPACDAFGQCVGEPYTCPPPGSCNSVQCDGKGGCSVINKPTGTTCDDGNRCTKDDQCLWHWDNTRYEFGCSGWHYSCPAPVQCKGSVSCDGFGGCETEPGAAGIPCDDGDPCTNGDVCDADGACKGTPDPACAPDAGPTDGGSDGELPDTPAQTCEPNKMKCTGAATLAVCRLDGSGFVEFECGPGTVCVQDDCKPVVTDAGAPDGTGADNGQIDNEPPGTEPAEKDSPGCGCVTLEM